MITSTFFPFQTVTTTYQVPYTAQAPQYAAKSRFVVDEGESGKGSIILELQGKLIDKRWLRHPLNVVIDADENEFIISDPRTHIHAAGATIAEAESEFRRVFAGYLDVLSQQEDKLSPKLRKQLHYLRSLIMEQ
jgi:predicted RNase H-like HicB family nuclease